MVVDVKIIIAFINGVACSLNETFLTILSSKLLDADWDEFQRILFPFLVYGKGFLSALFRNKCHVMSKLMHDFTN